MKTRYTYTVSHSNYELYRYTSVAWLRRRMAELQHMRQLPNTDIDSILLTIQTDKSYRYGQWVIRRIRTRPKSPTTEQAESEQMSTSFDGSTETIKNTARAHTHASTPTHTPTNAPTQSNEIGPMRELTNTCYISAKKPAKPGKESTMNDPETINRLREENARLYAKLDDYRKRLNRRSAELNQQTRDIQTLQSRLEDCRQDYDTLRLEHAETQKKAAALATSLDISEYRRKAHQRKLREIRRR